ncbi:Hypothetical predicted protein, partial [Paramuricea clavata]
SVSSVRSGESQRSVGSVNISLDLDEKPAVGTSRSGIASSSGTKVKPSSSRSKPGSRPGSQPGSPAGSKPGSRQGSARTGRRS